MMNSIEATAEVVRHRAAFDRIMTGGNSLASVLVGVFDAKIPPYETDFETARNTIKDPDVYDLWLCWAVMMRERDALAAPASAAVEAVEGMRRALEAQPCRCPVLLKCPHCEGDVVEGADQYSGSWICRTCMKTVGLPKDPARPCARCVALKRWEDARG